MRVGIYSGSFNPIHIGHLALANYLCEYGGMDEVWFLVTPRNPFKAHSQSLLPDSFRVELVRLSTAEYRRFRVDEIELSLPQPNYTIQTLDILRQRHPEHELYLVVGSDNWLKFSDWRESARLLREYRLIVYPRPGWEVDETSVPDTVTYLSNAPLLDVSSTFIRESLEKGLDVRYFLHHKVYERLLECRCAQ